ncbi:Anhydromuropeptide permease [Mycolicibacterium aubagnense]
MVSSSRTIDDTLDLRERTQGKGFLLFLGALYFTQGLPMGLAMEALPVLLRANGVSLELIALVPLTSLPWIAKIFWAPLVDNRWSPRLGRRRSWILSMQAVLTISMAALAFVPATPENAVVLFVLLIIGSIASATQDTATDGLAAETLRGGALGTANAFQVGGMMAGFMVGGGGVLIFAETLGQKGVMALLALIPALTFLAALRWRETSGPKASAPRASLLASFRRKGVGYILLLAFLYGGAHAGGVSVTKLFLIDLGWSVNDAGIVAALGGAVLILGGCPLGSMLVARSLWRAMMTGILLVIVAFAFWSALAFGLLPASWFSVVPATVILNLGSGVIAVSAATLVMAFGGSGHQAGTDVTLVQSVNVLGEMMIAGLVVWTAAHTGYGPMFAIVAVACLGLLAVVHFVRYGLPAGVLTRAGKELVNG